MQRQCLDELALTAAARCLGAVVRPGDVLLLDGTLGAGKTTFARALAHGLGITHPQRVRSPTFNLCLVHPGPIALAHLDLYRFVEPDESSVAMAALDALDLASLAEAGGNEEIPEGSVVLVEWARAWREAPSDALHIHLSYRDAEHRDLRVHAGGPRSEATLVHWVERWEETCLGAEKSRNT